MPSVDEIFKSGLENLRIDPETSVWSGLEKALVSKEAKVVLPWYYNPKKALIGALLISLFSFTVGFVYALLFNEVAEAPKTEMQTGKEQMVTNPIERPLTYTDAYSQDVQNDFEISNANQIAYAEAENQINNSTANKRTRFIEVDNAADNSNSFELSASKVASEGVYLLAFVPNRLKEVPFITENFDSIAKVSDASIPTLAINDDLENNNWRKNWLAVGYNANQEISGYKSSFNDATSIIAYKSEYWKEVDNSLSLSFGRLIHKNIGFATGLVLSNSLLSIKGHNINIDKDPGSNLENRDKVAILDYRIDYAQTSLAIPLALRFTGKYKMFGYHADFGGFAQKELSNLRSYSISDADWNSLINTWPASMYAQNTQFGLYSIVGFDTYFSNGFGLSFKAIIRKRYQQTLPTYLQGSNVNLGAQIGLFYRF